VPELPEVETVRQGLAKWVAGRTIKSVEVHHPRSIRRHLPGDAHFIAMLTGRTILDASRRGKYLWLPLDSGDAIIGHLGMSGQLLMQPPGAEDEKHLRIRFTFTDDGPELRFIDQRTFGGLSVSEDGAELPHEIAHIARDPMDDLFDDEEFVNRWRAKHTEAKRALLDQTLISGVGNIYADEALFRARIHPLRPVGTLKRDQIAALRDAVVESLEAGIDARGATIDDFRHPDGAMGSFQDRFLVHLREGEPCVRCGRTVVKMRAAGRGTYVCERCQPRPRPRARRST
jgi:formamidopyrimidine-DNA glycosylase